MKMMKGERWEEKGGKSKWNEKGYKRKKTRKKNIEEDKLVE